MSNKMDFEGLTFQVGGLEVNETAWAQIAAVADLNQTISGTYSQAEVQAISDKVDALLAAMRTAGFLAS